MSLFRFCKDRRGGVAPMFAIAVIPVFGLVGAAVDYSRANSIRAGMQSAIDATSLAMAKLAPTLTENELKTKSDDYFRAMFNHPEAKNSSSRRATRPREAPSSPSPYRARWTRRS